MYMPQLVNAREAHLINRTRALHKPGINRRDEAHQCHTSHTYNLVLNNQSLSRISKFKLSHFFSSQPQRKVELQAEISS